MPEVFVSPWKAQSGWAGHAVPGRSGLGGKAPGVRLEPLGRQALATVIVKSGQDRALGEAMTAHFGFGLPAAGRAAFGPPGGLVWSAPGQWLAVAAEAMSFEDWPARLADLAAVTDQGDARALVRVSGPDARTALAKGVSLDLHPAVFTSGAAASTAVAHMAVQLWRLDAPDTYVVAVPRSFAGSFWGWLMTAAAGFGVEVVSSDPA